MKNRFALAAGALAVIVVVVAGVLWWRSSSDPDLIITSDDGLAELRIPDGAIPSNVDPAVIRMTRTQAQADGLLAQYRLEPDGLSFAKPIQAVVNIPLPDQPATNDRLFPVPAFVLMSGDGEDVERIPVVVELDEARQAMQTVGAMEHFSTLNVLSYVSGRIDNPADHVVGESFFVGARLSQDRTQVRVPIADDPDLVAYVHEMSTLYLQSGSLLSRTRATTPERIDDVPRGAENPASAPLGRPNFSAVRQFTCVNPGEASISYRVYVDGAFRHFIEDREGGQTQFDVPNEDLGDSLVVRGRAFRCLAADETVVQEPTEEQLVDRSHDLLLLKHGRFETTITPSSTRVMVGETVNIDAVILDVTDQAFGGLPTEARTAYQTNWGATGVWTADPVFDRTDVEVDNDHLTPYLGRITFRLPLRCVSPGMGVVHFNSFIWRVLEAEGLHRQMPSSGGTSIQTAPIECVAVAQDSESQTEPIRFGVDPTGLAATHFVGGTSCPQLVGAVFVEGETGAIWSAAGAPPWINIPDSGTVGEDVPVYFNCNISNLQPHVEEGVITFTSGGQTAELTVQMNIE